MCMFNIIGVYRINMYVFLMHVSHKKRMKKDLMLVNIVNIHLLTTSLPLSMGTAYLQSGFWSIAQTIE